MKSAVGSVVLALAAIVLSAKPLCAATPGATPDPAAAAAGKARAEQISRGGYLTVVGGCGDCHTPMKMGANGPEPDMANMLSGHPSQLKMPAAPAELGKSPWVWAGAGTNTAFAGPWGISYAANLTPDQATGLGGWTEAQFVATMRTGHHLGTGRPILPPMPWTNLQRMKDEDLRAVFAYLRVIKPVTNRVPEIAPADAPPAAKVAQR